jgi:hypothetical protein
MLEGWFGHHQIIGLKVTEPPPWPKGLNVMGAFWEKKCQNGRITTI